MAAMGEVSQQQVLDLLYEVADDVSDVRAELNELVVLMKTINYEAEMGLQQIAEARSRHYEKVSVR
jgi:hypothetical protein